MLLEDAADLFRGTSFFFFCFIMGSGGFAFVGVMLVAADMMERSSPIQSSIMDANPFDASEGRDAAGASRL